VQLASPIFLLALLPWVALVLWLLLGKRRRVNVSFLDLWKGPVSGPTARRRIGMPPLALLAALAALLLMIVAASRPGIHRNAAAADVPVIIIVDRGLTMSMGKPPRFAALLTEIQPLIRRQFAQAAVETVYVPQSGTKDAPPTGLDTRAMLEVAVREQLQAKPASPVIVLSDQDLKIDQNRLVKAAPNGAAANISIAHLAARISPMGQAQVRLRNQSPQNKTVVRVLCDEKQTARQEVQLPPTSQLRDYFFPIDPAAKVIRVQIDAPDDFAADNAAFLVRRGSWPMMEARTPIFPELQRLIDKYSKLRPAGLDSKRVELVTAQDVGAGPQIILANPGSPATGKPSVTDHSITTSLEKVDWESLARDGLSEPVGDGWKPLVRIGNRTAMAIRETPSRQLWLGISTQKLATSPEFVILWSNIFDWVGEGGQEFAAQSTGQLDAGWTPREAQPPGLKPGWWPGIYRRADSALLAVNAPDVQVPQNPQISDWRTQLSQIATDYRSATATLWLTVPLLIASLLLMILAAATWRGGLKKPAPAARPYARSTSGAIDAT